MRANNRMALSVDSDKEGMKWFAMRATFRRELAVKAILDEKKIDSFVPMHYVLSEWRRKKVKMLVPIIHNLIFVRWTRGELQQFKSKVPFLQYMTRKVDGKNVPIVVPDQQMTDFIGVTNTHNDELIYLRPGDARLREGTPVRVHGGAFDGREGVFVKIEGRRNRRVVIDIQDVISVAFSSSQADYLEVLR